MWNLDNSYARLPDSLHQAQPPVPVPAPRLLLLNQPLAEALGLSVAELDSAEGVAVLAGNALPAGSQPLAQAYAGHQFGHFTLLGDGRAVLLGEQLAQDGQRYDIQLKGSGMTPFSRRGDGRAALGPMLREYIISEALHGLGIPCTRSLAVVASGDTVLRPLPQPGAVLTRVAASHVRVGTFEYAIRRGGAELVRALADWCIERHYPHCRAADNPWLALLQAVVARQAALIARWMQVGFIHGVMNTDNMSIAGESIDFGPCAFMDAFNRRQVFSSIDEQGRYAWVNQPGIGQWNLTRFAEALLPLLDPSQDVAIELAQQALADYARLYQQHWLEGMAAKLGLFEAQPEDTALIEDWLDLLQAQQADFTNSFRALGGDPAALAELPPQPLFDSAEFAAWQQRWQQRRSQQAQSLAESSALMNRHNPQLIARNHQVERALQAAERDDLQPLLGLLEQLRQPYASRPGCAPWCQLPLPHEQVQQTFCGT